MIDVTPEEDGRTVELNGKTLPKPSLEDADAIKTRLAERDKPKLNPMERGPIPQTSSHEERLREAFAHHDQRSEDG